MAAVTNTLAEDRGVALRADARGRADSSERERGAGRGRHLPGEPRGRRVNEVMLEEADLLLVMGPQLRRLFGDLPNKVCALPEYVGEPATRRSQPLRAHDDRLPRLGNARCLAMPNALSKV
jgi:hypothetical protein